MGNKYIEKLKDPRWQQKRLRIMERDNFTCQCCRDSSTELQIHHLKYLNDNDPWDCPDEYLITYCRDCHGLITNFIKVIKGFEINDLSGICIPIDLPDGAKMRIYRYKDRGFTLNGFSASRDYLITMHLHNHDALQLSDFLNYK